MSETVNLRKSYAALNEKLIELFDGSGVRRSFTVPYIDGQGADEHINTVGAAAAQKGGMTQNLIMSAHHSTGKGWGSGDGHTVAHPSAKLRETVIPVGDEKAKAVVSAAQKHISNMKFLLGDDNPAVQQAQGQLDLVKKTDGAGMTLFDFGTLVINMMVRPTQLVAQAHAANQPGGPNPQLKMHQEPVSGAQGEAPAPGEASPAQTPDETASASPEGQEQGPDTGSAPAAGGAPVASAPPAAAAPSPAPPAQG